MSHVDGERRSHLGFPERGIAMFDMGNDLCTLLPLRMYFYMITLCSQIRHS